MLRELKGMTVGVVGGKGKMGSWLCSKLEEVGLKVMVSDKKGGKDFHTLARDCQIIILSLPFQSLRTVMEEMSPFMTKDSLLMDMGSIKEQPLKIMLELNPGPVVGTHPLFGPESFNSWDLKVILCPGRGENAIVLATALWKQLGCETFVLSAEEHDRIMGIAQGVFHFTSIVMAKLLYDAAPKDRSALNKASTANFQKALERIKSILSQPFWLFGDILIENRYSFLWIKRFLGEAEALADILLRKDVQTYSSLFQKLGEVFKDEGDMGQDKGMGQGVALSSD
jgi:prephenate dehydrogenase